MLNALSAAFRDVQFMPTGGVNTSNLNDYLAVPSVIACGGSWLTPPKKLLTAISWSYNISCRNKLAHLPKNNKNGDKADGMKLH